MSGLCRIEPRVVKLVWGEEVWFRTSPDARVLVKFITTHDVLSVQVHPNKTEMWHILEAAPDARIAVGFTREVSEQELRDAIKDGTVNDMLNWVPVKAGDTLFAPSGVVHAIGAGITLCEIQQNSEVTYRLYDYGRKPERELHLEQGLGVAQRTPHGGRREFPVCCEFFDADEVKAPERCECGTLLVDLDAREVFCATEPVDFEPRPGARVLRVR